MNTKVQVFYVDRDVAETGASFPTDYRKVDAFETELRRGLAEFLEVPAQGAETTARRALPQPAFELRILVSPSPRGGHTGRGHAA